MIVDPDFLTHWKTRQLITMLGTEAPVAIISLWCYCQNRRTDTLELSNPLKLASICDWTGDGKQLFDAVTSCGFLDHVGGDSYQVHGWRERNKQITRMWKNQAATKSKPIQNEYVSNTKPIRNEIKTNSILSDLISSNLVEEEESEEEETGAQGKRFDEIAATLAKCRDGWQPSRISGGTKRQVFDDWARFATVTDDELAAVVEFYTLAVDERLCGSLGAVVSKLPEQIERAIAWKASQSTNGRNAGMRQTASADEYRAASEARRSREPEPEPFFTPEMEAKNL